MSRATYVFAPDHPEADENGMVDKRLAGERRVDTHHVISDALDYVVHPANGKRYTSKALFRETTRAYGLTEVGNEPVRFDKPKSNDSIGQDLARAWDQLSSR